MNERPAPTYERTVITPEMATEMLKHNTHNRALREPVVAKYMRDFLAGRWMENGDTIRFDWNGVLIDGQHKLKACERSRVPFTIVVVRGLDPAAQDTIDGGAKRTSQDAFTLDGEENASILSSILTRVWLWDNGNRKFSTRNGPTLAEQRSLLAERPEIRRSVQIARRVNGSFRFVSASCAGTSHYLFNRIDPDTTVWFFQKFGDGLNIEAGDPVGALRKRLMNEAATEARKVDARTMTYIVSAWNAVRDGRPMDRVASYEKGQDIPEPK